MHHRFGYLCWAQRHGNLWIIFNFSKYDFKTQCIGRQYFELLYKVPKLERCRNNFKACRPVSKLVKVYSRQILRNPLTTKLATCTAVFHSVYRNQAVPRYLPYQARLSVGNHSQAPFWLLQLQVSESSSCQISGLTKICFSNELRHRLLALSLVFIKVEESAGKRRTANWYNKVLSTKEVLDVEAQRLYECGVAVQHVDCIFILHFHWQLVC